MSHKKTTIGIIGYGHMGKAIAIALKKTGATVMHSNHAHPHKDNATITAKSNIVILATRPFQIRDVLKEIANKITPSHIVISIAAGVPLRFLQKVLPKNIRLVRVMPNLPAQCMAGVSGWIGKNLSVTDKNQVRKILQSFGIEVEVSREDHINTITALSGSGPAYVFAFLESLENEGRRAGLTKRQAREIAMHMVLGAVQYANLEKEDFKTLKNMVQTKGGTTEAAFQVLKKRAWQKAFESAIRAAADRARDIEKIF